MNYPFIPEEYSVVYGEGYESGKVGKTILDNPYNDPHLYHFWGEGLLDVLDVGLLEDEKMY